MGRSSSGASQKAPLSEISSNGGAFPAESSPECPSGRAMIQSGVPEVLRCTPVLETCLEEQNLLRLISPSSSDHLPLQSRSPSSGPHLRSSFRTAAIYPACGITPPPEGISSSPVASSSPPWFPLLRLGFPLHGHWFPLPRLGLRPRFGVPTSPPLVPLLRPGFPSSSGEPLLRQGFLFFVRGSLSHHPRYDSSHSSSQRSGKVPVGSAEGCPPVHT